MTLDRSAPAPAIVTRRSATLAVLSAAQFLIALDYSIIYVALPDIARDLRLAPALAQWTISAYAVLFAGFLVVGGRVSDRVGAGRLFAAAILIFGAASAAGALAGDATVLLAARGTQGFGAALLQPAVLGLIGTTFPAGPERTRALAIWGSVGASGLAAGVILSGLLTMASWRYTFVINIPVTLACALGAALVAGPAPARAAVGRVPARAALLATGTVLALVLGLTFGFGANLMPALGCLALALGLFAGFVRGERTTGRPLIDFALRRTRSLRVGACAAALYMASVGSEFYLVTLLLQTVQGRPPLQAGLGFLPLALMVTVGSTTTGRVVRRLAPAVVLAGGFAIATAGLLWLSLTLSGGSYAGDLLPGLLLSGFGHGVIYTSTFMIGTRDVPPAYQGTAGALLTTAQYLSGALTIAVLTLVLGTSPDAAGVRAAFLVTTAAAAAGLVLAVSARRRTSARGGAATGGRTRR